MKQIFLLFVVLALFGCSGSDDKPECVCELGKYVNTSGTGYYFVKNVALDCQTKQPILNNIGSGYYVGCQ